MNHKHAIGSAMLLFWTTSNLFAGGMSTGGGSAVVCRNSENQITYAEMLDLFEGRERFKMTINQSSDSPDVQVAAALERLNSNQGIKWFLKNLTEDLKAKQSFLPRHIGLHLPSDIGTDHAAYILDGCRLETVGYYENDGTLRIATKVYESLTPTSKAAFLLHESIYKATRDLSGESDSTKARSFVAKFFASGIDETEMTRNLSKLLSVSNNSRSNHFFVPVKILPSSKFLIHLFKPDGDMCVRLNVVNGMAQIIDFISTPEGNAEETVKQISATDVHEFDTGFSTVRHKNIVIHIDNEAKPIFELASTQVHPTSRTRIFIVRTGQ
ncbi:MAG: hypothetical protein NT027_02730 [Proteobacteria bacterium]|nr:hypothetical protein [Pseudomonadota bacterium]